MVESQPSKLLVAGSIPVSRSKKSFLFFPFILSLVCFPAAAWACTCGPPPPKLCASADGWNVPPRAETTIEFIGRVVDVYPPKISDEDDYLVPLFQGGGRSVVPRYLELWKDELKTGEERAATVWQTFVSGSLTSPLAGAGFGPLVVRYRFALDEPLFLRPESGAYPKHVDVFSGSGGADCSERFEPGKRYWIRAWRAPGGNRWYTGICAGNREAPIAGQAAPARLEQARAVRDRKIAEPFVFGAVWKTSGGASAQVQLRFPASGKEFQTRTGEDGLFLLEGLPTEETFEVRLVGPESPWKILRVMGSRDLARYSCSDLSILTGPVSETGGVKVQY